MNIGCIKSISRIKLLLLIILLALFFSKDLNAQNEGNEKSSKAINEFSLMFGLNNSILKDINFSPLNYRHSGLAYSISYNRVKKGNSIILTELNFLNNNLKTSNIDHFTSGIIIGNFKIGYLKKLANISSRTLYYLGAEYQTNAMYINYDEQEAFSFLISHGLNIKMGLTYRIDDKSLFYGSLAIPLMSLVVRPPYNSFDEQLQENLDNTIVFLTEGAFMTLDKYQSIDFSFSYNYRLSKSFDLKLDYRIVYQKVSNTNQFIQLQNLMRTGITYKF